LRVLRHTSAGRSIPCGGSARTCTTACGTAQARGASSTALTTSTGDYTAGCAARASPAAATRGSTPAISTAPAATSGGSAPATRSASG
jgi:hypothetical protein